MVDIFQYGHPTTHILVLMVQGSTLLWFSAKCACMGRPETSILAYRLHNVKEQRETLLKILNYRMNWIRLRIPILSSNWFTVVHFETFLLTFAVYYENS